MCVKYGVLCISCGTEGILTEPKTKLDELNLVDKFLFDESMEDAGIYQDTISILMEKEIELLEKPETEKELRVSPELREIRLDVVSMDSNRTIYYTEMQQYNTYNLAKRSRYYQAMMDVSLLEPGSVDFNRLKDTCFILVAPFDIFGRGLYRYTFEGVCRECPDLKLGDGALRIFINTKGTNREDFSQEFLDFMDYLTSSTDEVAERSESKKIKRIHEKVKVIKQAEKMGVRYMQRWEEEVMAREEGRSLGLKEGKTLGILQGMKLFIEDNLEEGISAERIVEKLVRKFEVTREKAQEYVMQYMK